MIDLAAARVYSCGDERGSQHLNRNLLGSVHPRAHHAGRAGQGACEVQA